VEEEPNSGGTAATVSGIVVNKLGNPMEAVRVQAYKTTSEGQDDARFVTTDASGAFRFDDLSVGTYKLIPMPLDRPMRQTQPAQVPNTAPITVSENDVITDVRLVYSGDEIHTISGGVVDRSGGPIEGAHIQAGWVRGGGGGGRVSYAETDAQGRYRFPNLWNAVFRVSVWHDDYSSATLDEVVADTNDADFILHGRGAIEGRVIEAASGAAVTVFQLGAFSLPFDASDSHTLERITEFQDPDGRFLLPKVEEGVATLLVRAEGYAPVEQKVSGILEGITVSGVIVRLEAGSTVEGVVLNDVGMPVADAKIYLGRIPAEDYLVERGAAVTTDGEGMFRITSVPPETSLISALHDDYLPGAASVDLAGGTTTHVTIQFAVGGSVEGTVQREGIALGNQQVTVSTPGIHGEVWRTSTDRNGHYTVSSVLPGTVSVSVMITEAHHLRRRMSFTALIQDGETTAVDFDLSDGPASMEGTVTVDGQFPSEGQIFAHGINPSGAEDTVSNILDEFGRYRLEGVPAGAIELTISASLDDTQPLRRRLDVETVVGQTLHKDIEMMSGAVVSGTVNGVSSEELAFAMLMIGHVSTDTFSMDFVNPREHLVVSTDTIQPGETSFVMEHLAPGDYTLFVYTIPKDDLTPGPARRFASQFITVDDDSAINVDLTLP
jgi:hypothetical protein